ncbi:MAG: hypothetical protein ABIR39_12555 [Nocardioides sp.]|uniref:hypothetical protein n=1 Tax=Nocardioides sp. TaxID=35761 RepID=UPI003264729B
MTRDQPGALRGLAQLIGGLFVDELARGAVFFSVIVFIAAVTTRNLPYLGLGVCVGIVGMVLPFVGMSRKWSDPVMAFVVSVVLVADAATLWLLWERA